MQYGVPGGGQSGDSLIGRSFGGYQITRFIARGGMGVVYEGVQVSLSRPVAIKILYPHLADDPSFVDRFQREARSAARLNHPHIVRVLDFGSEGDLFYMIMDYIEGESLRDRLARVSAEGLTLNTNTMMQIVQEVGSALSFAHGLGLVHRDVKPGNVLLGKDGHAYLADFGVVKILGEASMTMAGTIVGTPEYMAPEQGMGVADIGPPADLYSLAIITYEMMVGRAPFKAQTPAAVLQMQLTQPPPPPSTLVPWIAPEVEDVIMRALAKDPAHRYPSVDDYVKALTIATASLRERATSRYAAASMLNTPPPGTQPTGTLGSQPSGATPLTPAQALAAGLGAASQAGAQSQPGLAGTPAGFDPAGATVGGWGPASTGSGTMTPPGGMGGGTPPPTAEAAPFSEPAPGSRKIYVFAAVAVLAVLALFGYVLSRDNGDGNNGGGGGVVATATSKSGSADATATVQVATPTVAAEASPTEKPAEPTATEGSSAEPTPTEAASEPTATTEAATPTVEAGAAPPGYKSVILFASHRGEVHDSEIYIMNPDGSDEHQLTFSRGHSWGPRVSPDGTQFFFSSVAPGEHTDHSATGGGTTGSGNHDIYLSNTDGSNITKLTFETSWDNGWSWSHDGNWITFTSDRDGNWDIYRMDKDGSNVVRMTDEPAEDGWPSWSPDGTRVIFSSNRTGSWEIYSMAADGSDVHQLTDRPETVDTYPYVSPDGKRIVFSSGVESANEAEIYVMDADGSNLTRLTSTVALNYAPSWAPDGSKIVFASDRDGNSNIYIMNPDGTDQQRLTDDPGEDTTPCWAWIKVDQ